MLFSPLDKKIFTSSETLQYFYQIVDQVPRIPVNQPNAFMIWFTSGCHSYHRWKQCLRLPLWEYSQTSAEGKVGFFWGSKDSPEVNWKAVKNNAFIDGIS